MLIFLVALERMEKKQFNEIKNVDGFAAEFILLSQALKLNFTRSPFMKKQFVLVFSFLPHPRFPPPRSSFTSEREGKEMSFFLSNNANAIIATVKFSELEDIKLYL
jgi:hypothetical protein